jgi:hypothetical protein
MPANGKVTFDFLTDSVLHINNPYVYAATEDTLYQRDASPGWGKNFRYTISYLAKGDYYLKVPRYTGHGAYQMKYEFIPDPRPEDKEPNDSVPIAVRYIPGDTVTGHMGYVHRNDDPPDRYDYYVIRLPRPGIVTFKVDVSSDLSHEIYFYEPDGKTLRERNKAGYDTTRTMVCKNLLADTNYYLLIYNYSGVGNYELTSSYLPVPIAQFTAITNLSTLYLNDESIHGDSLLWDFGDGNTSTKRNPTHQYETPGYYTVTQKAINAAGEDSVKHYASVRGIQNIVSDRGGNGGKVTARINAGGLKEGVQVLLRHGTEEIQATDEKFITAGDLEFRLNLYQATLGKWDVVVRNPGEAEMVLKEGFLVEQAVLPQVWAEVQGRNRAVFGRWQTYTVTFGNKGNIDAFSRISWIVTPDGDSVDVEFLNVNFDFPKAFTPDVYQGLKKDIPYYLAYDTIDGEARQVRLYGLMVSTIPANSQLAIKLRVKSYHDFTVSVFQTEPFIEYDYNASSAPMVRSAEEFSSYESCVRWAIGKMMASKVVDLIASQIPGADCVVDVVNTTSSVASDLGAGEFSFCSFAWSMSSTVWSCAKEFPGPLKAYETAREVTGFIMDMKGIVDDMIDGYKEDQQCQKYKKKQEKKIKVNTRSSEDPNIMVGPVGFGKDNVVSKQVFPYTILFENKKTATAPAQEVVILDALDTKTFNVNSLKFTGFGFAGNDYSVAQDSNRFVSQLDLRPAKNALLRVSGQVDPLTGIVRWQFISLDPETMDLTEDPDAGFLNPNVNSPEGEGYVSFIVPLNDQIRTGDTVLNRANIFFDVNKPIMTNDIRNIIDEKAPVSKVVSAKGTDVPGEIELFIEGNDPGGAGVMHYNLYVSVEDSAFGLAYSKLRSGTFKLRVPMGKTYRFYTLAVDSLNFIEPAKTEAEASYYLPMKLNAQDVASDGMLVLPNPLNTQSVLYYNLPQSGLVELTLLNLSGQPVKTLLRKEMGAGVQELPLGNLKLPAGVYLIKLLSNGKTTLTKVIVP